MAYNEVASLEAVIREIACELKRLHFSAEVLVVDDGSTDGTAEVAENCGRQIDSVRVIHHAHNQGLGGVYRTGLSTARGELVTFFPADGQFPASIIGQFVPLMGNLDMVLGFLPKAQRSALAQLLSLAERALYRCLFGSMPRFQGVMMFRRRILQDMDLRSSGRGWAIVMELILRSTKREYRIGSVATECRPRLAGRSKVKDLRTILSNLQQMFKLRQVL